MNYGINLLVKFVGALSTSYGLMWLGKLASGVSMDITIAPALLFLTIGLTLLFAPEIKKK